MFTVHPIIAYIGTIGGVSYMAAQTVGQLSLAYRRYRLARALRSPPAEKMGQQGPIDFNAQVTTHSFTCADCGKKLTMGILDGDESSPFPAKRCNAETKEEHG